MKPEGQFPLPEGSETLFHDFRNAGYATGAFGKWGLGFVGTTGDPNRQGVDRFYGFNCQTLAHSYYPDHLWDNDVRIDLADVNRNDDSYGTGAYAPDLIHEQALAFLEQAVKDGKPFFLWYPTTIPHAELIVPQDSIIQRLRGKYPETPYNGVLPGGYRFQKGAYIAQSEPHATFAAMVTRLDVYVGQIVDKLKELGVYDNTILIFSSDNGPHLEGGADPDFFDSNGPWRGYKRDVYEGGIRVPMIVSWEGHVKPGTETDFMCTFWDLMPTFRELVGSKADAGGLDGISILPLLEGRKGQKEHDSLYFEFQERGGSQAVRKGDWKLVHLNICLDNPVYELYNLADDPGETNDLSAAHPDIVADLQAMMVESHIPNPAFPLLKGEKTESQDEQ
jgi:arylsulfatase A-like enzyme